MNQDDAISFLIQWLRNPSQSTYPSYGYDVFISNVLRVYVQNYEDLNPDHPVLESRTTAWNRIYELSPYFYAAAWELCRRGIIRPGVRSIEEHGTLAGKVGEGYSITPFGHAWLAESDQDDFVPTEPGRFAQMLAPYRFRYGGGFQERAQEAIRCYGAHAYLACCAMCGAATESILLATAIAKSDEQTVLKEYATSGGRRRVENRILGKARRARSQGSNPWQTQVMALGVFCSSRIFLWTWSPLAAIKRPSV